MAVASTTSSNAKDSFGVSVGAVLEGKYTLVDELGRGSMGVVYLAEDLHLRRKVAVKFLLPELSRSKECADRFRQEAVAMAAINDANVAQIFTFGEVSVMPYFAMEHLDGVTVQDLIDENRDVGSFVPIRLALDILWQILGGLAEIHRSGAVHRDIKPANIMLGSFGEVQVMDWGLAKAVGATADAQETFPVESVSDVVEVDELVYSKSTAHSVRWVIAVREDSPVQTVHDLQGKRIATELVGATKRYLASKGVTAEVDFSWGTTEAKANISGLVDAIVEVTETGSTIKANYALRSRTAKGEGYKFDINIPKGTPYPTHNGVTTIIANAFFDGQQEVELDFFRMDIPETTQYREIVIGENHNLQVEENISDEQKVFTNEAKPEIIKLDPPAKSGERRLEITFDVSINKDLLITVKDLRRNTIIWKRKKSIRLD